MVRATLFWTTIAMLVSGLSRQISKQVLGSSIGGARAARYCVTASFMDRSTKRGGIIDL